MGNPALGKTFNVEAMDIVRLNGGKMVEHWGVIDAAAMAKQLSRRKVYRKPLIIP